MAYLGRTAQGGGRPEPCRNRKALEDFLREQYALMAEEPSAPEYNFRFARGSFGAEFTTLRDLPKETVGILQREGEYDWRDPPTRQLITRRNALPCARQFLPPTSPFRACLTPPLPGALMFDEDVFVRANPPRSPTAIPTSTMREWRSWHGYDERGRR